MAESADDALIATRSLCLSGGPRKLVASLDWCARPGEFWCVLGANGAGKSSLLAALAGINPAARTALRWRGLGPGTIDARKMARLRGYMPQDVHDAFSATVLDTVLLGRYAHGHGLGWENARDVALARAALHQAGLPGIEVRDVRSLSGGERQRVALAMLLTQDAPLLLLDEPTSHQDPGHQVQVGALLAHLARAGRTVVAALHDVNQALRFASHALVLMPDAGAVQGEIHATLTDAVLERAYGHPFRTVTDGASRWMLPA